MKYFSSVFLIIVFQSVFGNPPNWQQISGTEFSFVAMVKISHFEQIFEEENVNLVGAFGENGTCRGIAMMRTLN